MSRHFHREVKDTDPHSDDASLVTEIDVVGGVVFVETRGKEPGIIVILDPRSTRRLAHDLLAAAMEAERRAGLR